MLIAKRADNGENIWMEDYKKLPESKRPQVVCAGIAVGEKPCNAELIGCAVGTGFKRSAYFRAIEKNGHIVGCDKGMRAEETERRRNDKPGKILPTPPIEGRSKIIITFDGAADADNSQTTPKTRKKSGKNGTRYYIDTNSTRPRSPSHTHLGLAKLLAAIVRKQIKPDTMIDIPELNYSGRADQIIYNHESLSSCAEGKIILLHGIVERVTNGKAEYGGRFLNLPDRGGSIMFNKHQIAQFEFHNEMTLEDLIGQHIIGVGTVRKYAAGPCIALHGHLLFASRIAIGSPEA